MSAAQTATFWMAAGAYVVSTIAAFAGIGLRRERMISTAWWAALAGLVAHSAAIGVRWVAAGHFPYVQQYENILVGTWAMILGYLVLARLARGLSAAGGLIVPVVLVTLGYAVTLPTDLSPVTPVLQSGWLVVHVTFAWITYSAYSMVAGIAFVDLLRERAARRGQERKPLPAWFPAHEEIDSISAKLVAFGFLNNGVMIVSGAIWAYRLWGSYWNWDPVETWSLLTWLAYGFYLHAYLTLGWRGKRLAWVALLALFGVMMAFWGVQLLPSSYHVFKNLGETLTNPRF